MAKLPRVPSFTQLRARERPRETRRAYAAGQRYKAHRFGGPVELPKLIFSINSSKEAGSSSPE